MSPQEVEAVKALLNEYHEGSLARLQETAYKAFELGRADERERVNREWLLALAAEYRDAKYGTNPCLALSCVADRMGLSAEFAALLGDATRGEGEKGQ